MVRLKSVGELLLLLLLSASLITFSPIVSSPLPGGLPKTVKGSNWDDVDFGNGTHAWSSAPVRVWNGSAWNDYVYVNDTKKGCYRVQVAGIATEVYYNLTVVHYDPAVSEVRLENEQWSMFNEASKAYLSLGSSWAFKVDANESGFFLTATLYRALVGTLTIVYWFQTGGGLKHTVSFTLLAAVSLAAVSLKQSWKLPSTVTSVKVDDSAKVSDGKYNGTAFQFLDSKGVPLLFEDQSASKTVLQLTDVNFTAKAVTYTFGNFSLSTGQMVTVDPTTETYNASAGDGWIYAVLSTWDAAHDATSGTAGPTDVTLYIGCVDDGAGTVYVERGFFPFDTSGLPDYAIISAANVGLRTTLSGDGDNDGYDYVVVVGPTTQASNTTLASTDFDDCSTINTPTQCSNKIDLTGLSTGYKNFTLNSAGISCISTTSYTKLGLREGHDVDDHPVAASTDTRITVRGSESTTNKPQISITYTVDSTPPTATVPASPANTTIPGAVCNFSCQWSDETALSKATLETNNTGVYVNATWLTLSGTGPSWANFTITLNATAGRYVWYKWYCNDTSNNMAQTNTSEVYMSITLTSSDSSSPTYTLPATPYNQSAAGYVANFSCYWNDNTNVTTVNFCTNNSGIWVNTTMTPGTNLIWNCSTGAWANFTVTLNTTIGVVVQYLWNASDAIPNWNTTMTAQSVTTVFYASLTIVTTSHTWTCNPGDSHILINEGVINVTVTSNGDFQVQVKSESANLVNGTNTIAVSNIETSKDTTAYGLGFWVNLNTTYQTIPGSQYGYSHGTNVVFTFLMWLSVPAGTRAGTYTYTLDIQVIQA